MPANSVDTFMIAAATIALGAFGLVWLRGSADRALAAWCITIGFVPVWMGVDALYYWTPATIAAVAAIIALAPFRRVGTGPVDWTLAWFFAGAGTLGLVVSGTANAPALLELLSQWAVAFLLGRLVLLRLPYERVVRIATAVMTAVAVLALVEAATGANLFVGLGRDNGLHTLWGTLQERGEVARVEGAFGHSIALGCSLAMMFPLVLGSRIPRRRQILVLTLMGAAIVATLSRLGMSSALLGAGLSLLFLPNAFRHRTRLAIAATTSLAVFAFLPFVERVYRVAGSEATESARYRTSLYSLVSDFAITGRSPIGYTDRAGRLAYGEFHSIDSAFVLLGLTFGWVALGTALLLLAAAAVAVLRRRASSATIAVVAQIPALAAVALITQYAMWFWFIVGLAAGEHALRAHAAATGDASPAVVDQAPAVPALIA